MIDREHVLPVTHQAQLLELSRSAVYYRPTPVSDGDLVLMRRIDERHLEHPFAGSRMLKQLLRNDGFVIGRTHVRTLMRRMGIEAIYRRPRTSQPHPGHRIFPYLLRGQVIERANHVWALDITYRAPSLWRRSDERCQSLSMSGMHLELNTEVTEQVPAFCCEKA